MTPKNDKKFERKLDCGFENDMKNLGHFYHCTSRSQIWDFDGILLSKLENP